MLASNSGDSHGQNYASALKQLYRLILYAFFTRCDILDVPPPNKRLAKASIWSAETLRIIAQNINYQQSECVCFPLCGWVFLFQCTVDLILNFDVVWLFNCERLLTPSYNPFAIY